MSTIKVILRKDSVNKEGKSPLVLKLYKDQKVKQVTLPKCAIFEKDWDEQLMRVKNDKMMTLRIHNEIAKYQKAVVKLEIFEEDYNLNDVVDLVRGKKVKASNKKEKISIRIVQYLEERFVNNEILRYGTRKNYKSLKRMLVKLKENPKLEDIDGTYLGKIEKLIKRRYNYSHWTVHTRIKCLKRTVQKAFEEGLIQTPKWNGYKMKKGKSDKKFLSSEELKALKLFKTSTELDQRILKAFLFCCFTGMRCGDMQVLTYKNFKLEVQETGSSYRLRYSMRKNGNEVSTIISNNVINLIDTNQVGTDRSVFQFISKGIVNGDEDKLARKLESNNAYINKRLKVIQMNAGLNRVYSFHESRHTFFCQGIKLGINNNILKELGGLDSTEVLLKHYAKLVDDSKTEAMNKFDLI